MSRLSWNEIRTRAHGFANEWKDACYERGETQTFYNEFFEIFGVSRRRVATFEEPVKKLGNKQGFIDLFWKGVLLVEQKSAGRNLENAKQQALDYFPGLSEEELPRYVLACDFQNFELYDLESGEQFKFTLKDLYQHVDKFAFVLGVQKRTLKAQDPVNIKASLLMGRLHDALYASGFSGHDLEQFLVRLLFCLFADDTGIFEPRDIFDELLRTRTKEDGTDVGQVLAMLFQVLNQPEGDRSSALDRDLAQFPYINGDLFAERLSLPSFNATMRSLLLEACEFSWDAISPAIFGALFQHVSGDAAARRAHGEHYTTEAHILRLIGPLFLDDLSSELNAIRDRRGEARNRALRAYADKLSRLKFFDPACGCGNFLIIAYREIRRLELSALTSSFSSTSKDFGASLYSQVTVDQFYGIEINEFPARIAEVALWMMDHIMNLELSLALGTDFRRIPIKDKPHIVHADALALDWNTVLPATDCSFILGNPPFLGAKVQSELQREQVRQIAALGKSGGTLDFVCAWYIKAGQYVQGTGARIAFVSTNSITQGEQVAQLWPRLLDDFGLEIAFAHRTFEWSSDVKGKAHVHVVIVGLTLSKEAPKLKRLFSYAKITDDPTESNCSRISPYLIDASRLTNPHLVVHEASKPLFTKKSLCVGSKPVDGGTLIISCAEYDRMAVTDAVSASMFRPFVDAQDYIKGEFRYILACQSASPAIVKSSSVVTAMLDACKKWRLSRSSPGTVGLASVPSEYHVTVIPDSEFLLIPRHSSETRDYVPIGFLAPPVIPSDASIVMLSSTLFDFAIITSRMHMAWLREIGGRLESRYRYSIGIVYNTFPWPSVTGKQQEILAHLATEILAARASHPGSTLSDLYDPVTMPANLRKAHQSLDREVDKLYRPTGFGSDHERVEHLLGLYGAMTSIFASPHPSRPRRRSK